MAAVALIVLDQGGPGPAGQAFEGTLAGGAVTVTNDDDTDVSTFTFTMLDVPPGSTVATGVMATGAPPSTASFTPDVPGSYRVQLEVTDGTTPDVDIRCFGVRNARGIIVPPYQRNPDPKPLPGSGLPGAKPDEQNYGGQARGWAGDRTAGQLEQFFQTYDDLPSKTVTSTPFAPALSNEEPLSIIDLAAIGGNAVVNLQAGARVGQPFRIQAVGGTSFTVTVNMPPGHTINGQTDLVILDGGGENFVFLGGTLWARVGATVDDRIGVPDYSAAADADVLTVDASAYVEPITVVAGPSLVWALDSQFSQTGDPTIFSALTGINTVANEAVDRLTFGASDEVGLGGIYDGVQYIWLISGDFGTGNGLLRAFDPAVPSVSAPNIISPAGVTAIDFGGAYLWVAENVGAWRINPAFPGGPYTPLVGVTGGADIAYDADTTHYGDVQPRVWIADSSNQQLVRVDVNTTTVDGTIPLAGVFADNVALGQNFLWTAKTVTGVARIFRNNYDPPAAAGSSGSIDAVFGGGWVWDCVYEPTINRLFVLGQDPPGNSYLARVVPTTMAVDGSIMLAPILPSSGGNPPRMTVIGSDLWVALMGPSAGGQIFKVNPATLAATQIDPYKTIGWEATALSGDVTGTVGSNTVERIRGNNVDAAAPTADGEQLIWNVGANRYLAQRPELAQQAATPAVMSSTPFTMLDGVAVLKVRTSTIAGPSIVNLASRSFPQEVIVVDEDGDADQYLITIVAPGGETINGNVNVQIHEKYGRVRLYYDGGTEWFVLSSSGGAFDTNRILTGQLFS